MVRSSDGAATNIARRGSVAAPRVRCQATLMLKITPESLAALTAVEERAFVQRLTTMLRVAVPALADEPAAAMAAQVQLQIEAARDYGMTSERAVATYVMTAAQLGVDFPDQFGGARDILLSRSDGDRKADRLEAFTLRLFDALAQE